MYKWRQIKVIKPLSNLKEGETGKIVQVRGKPVMHLHLCGMGLAVGRCLTVEKEGTAAQDSAIMVSVNNRTVTIEKNLALDIKVQVPVTIAENEIPDMAKAYARATVLR